MAGQGIVSNGPACPELVEGSAKRIEGQNMKYYVYILQCCDGSFYVGHTENLPNRLKTHQSGDGAFHAKIKAPFKLVYSEEFDLKENAIKREIQIKKWSRTKKKALIDGSITNLKKLSKKKFRKKIVITVNE